MYVKIILDRETRRGWSSFVSTETLFSKIIFTQSGYP